MNIYLVGGAVRDELLQIEPPERDWVVVGATPEQLLGQGYRQVNSGFPVFLHPETGEEYALARRETKVAGGYKGFELEYGPDVTLEEDLARRDLTINAMARDENGNIVDPYGGQEDLQQGLLRHVTPAFVEDPVRVIRIARFAATLGQYGFRVAHATHALLKQVAASGELQFLRGERIWKETRLAMAGAQPWRFYEVLHRCGALKELFAELAETMGDQLAHEPQKTDDLQLLHRCVAEDLSVEMRWPLLVTSLSMGRSRIETLIEDYAVDRHTAKQVLDLDQAQEGYRQLSTLNAEATLAFIEQHVNNFIPSDSVVISGLEYLYPELAEPHRQILNQACAAIRGVSTQDLVALGFQGRELGVELRKHRIKAISELQSWL